MLTEFTKTLKKYKELKQMKISRNEKITKAQQRVQFIAAEQNFYIVKELVSTSWLNQNLSNPNLIILDASIPKNAAGKAFESSNDIIPGARRFDLKNVFLDTTSPFPNTVPNPEDFQYQCQKLGINEDSEIVVYDNAGIYTSPRAWWLFKIMGHNNISVLNGGLPDWIANGYSTVKDYNTAFEHGNFKANYKQKAVISFEHIKRNCRTKDFVTVDARSSGRFNGTEKEPRANYKVAISLTP